jgi:hypothetical protein
MFARTTSAGLTGGSTAKVSKAPQQAFSTVKVVCIAYEYPRTFPSDWDFVRGGFIRAMHSEPSFQAAKAFGKIVKFFDAAKERFYKVRRWNRQMRRYQLWRPPGTS